MKQAWLLKNSHSRSSQKFHRARMPYKRRSRFWWTLILKASLGCCSPGNSDIAGSDSALLAKSRLLQPSLSRRSILCAFNYAGGAYEADRAPQIQEVVHSQHGG